MGDALVGGRLHVALALVDDQGAVRDQADGLLDHVHGEELVAVTGDEHDRRLDAGKHRAGVVRNLGLELDQEVRGRVALPGEKTASDQRAEDATGPPASLARKHVLGERHPETGLVAPVERIAQAGVDLLAPVVDLGGGDHESELVPGVAVQRGQVLRDHPAEGLTHHEIDPAVELIRDQAGVVVRHVLDAVPLGHVPATGDVPDGVSLLDERVEPPPGHPGEQSCGDGTPWAAGQEQQRLGPSPQVEKSIPFGNVPVLGADMRLPPRRAS